MHIVALARGAYIASIAGEREEKRGQMYKTFLKDGEPACHSPRNWGSGDRLFCRQSSSLSPPFGKELLAEETLRLLDVACATEPFHQWERRMTGFAVVLCCSPQSRCPCRLSLICDHIRQLLQTQNERSTVMNGARDLQALSCQGSAQQIVMLACRCLREQGINKRLALLVSQLLVPLQACFQQDTRTSDRPLSQGDLSKEAKEPAGCPRVVGLSMDGDSFVQQGAPLALILPG